MDTIDETLAAPLLAGLRSAVDAVSSVADASSGQCCSAELLAAADAARELIDRASGLLASTVGDIDDCGLAAGLGCASTAALLRHRHRHRLDPRVAKAWEAHAYAVRTVFPVVAAGQRAGLVSAEQARVIVAGLDNLPATSTETDRQWAQRLVAQCAAYEARRR